MTVWLALALGVALAAVDGSDAARLAASQPASLRESTRGARVANVAVLTRVATPGGMYTDLVVDPSINGHRPVISYHDGENDLLKVAYCEGDTDAGCVPRLYTVGPGGRASAMAVVGEGDDALLLLAYCVDGDALGTNRTEVRSAVCSSTDCSEPLISTLGFDCDLHLSLSAGVGDAMPLVAYRDQSSSSTAKGLSVARCSDALCSEAQVSRLRGQGEFGDASTFLKGAYPSVFRLTPQSFPSIAFQLNITATTRGALPLGAVAALATCVDEQCARPPLIAVLDYGSGDEADVGRYSAAIASADGAQATVFYFSADENELRSVSCVSPGLACTAPLVHASSGAATYGEYIRARPAPDGFPAVAFYEQTDSMSSTLKVLRCASFDCVDGSVSFVASGDCGDGRDSTVAFKVGDDGGVTTFVSYMLYDEDGAKRSTMLATMTEDETVGGARKMPATRPTSAGLSPLGGFADLCASASGPAPAPAPAPAP